MSLVEEVNYGLRLQDLQENKDKLLLETSDMLQCSLFEAELLLKNHSWSKEELLQNWFEDKVKCYEKCGIICTAVDQNSTLNKEVSLSLLKIYNLNLSVILFSFFF